MYERTRVNVKVERGSSFTFTSDSSYIAPFLRAYVRKNYCGNPPLPSSQLRPSLAVTLLRSLAVTLLRSLAVTLRRSQVLIG